MVYTVCQIGSDQKLDSRRLRLSREAEQGSAFDLHLYLQFVLTPFQIFQSRMSTSQIKSTYRSLYRTYISTSSTPKKPTKVPSSINHYLRQLSTLPLKDIQPIIQYLHASKSYNDLLKRYNPVGDLNEPERLKATLNRVGLQMPKKVDADTPLLEK